MEIRRYVTPRRGYRRRSIMNRLDPGSQVVLLASHDPRIVALSIIIVGIVGISIVPVIVLVVALLTSVVDRLRKQRALLDELFEQAPQAVALMTDDDHIVRVNREFTHMLGSSPQEAIGRPLSDFIVSVDTQDPGGLEAYGTCQRIDGARLDVAMLRGPVSLPAEQGESYAILRDIPEQKKAEEALR